MDDLISWFADLSALTNGARWLPWVILGLCGVGLGWIAMGSPAPRRRRSRRRVLW